MNDFTAQSLAEALTNAAEQWRMIPNDISHAREISNGQINLWLTLDSKPSGRRIEISLHTPALSDYRPRDGWPHMTADLIRPPASIAADIRRRIIAPAIPLLQAARERKAKAEAESARLDAVADELAASLPGGERPDKRGSHYRTPYDSEKKIFCSRGGVYISARVNTDSVTFDRFTLPHGLAQVMLDALAPHMQPAPAPHWTPDGHLEATYEEDQEAND